MTINPSEVDTDSNRIDYNPDGIETVFTYDFQVNEKAWLEMYADGELYTEAYSISGLENPTGGEITFDVAPDGHMQTLTIIRVIPLTQEISYPTFGPFPAASHESALDKLTWISQQHDETFNRSLKGAINSDPDIDFTLPFYSAGLGLMWSETEKRIVNSNDNLNTIVADVTAAFEDTVAYATYAQASAAAAALSEATAEKWATEAEDVEVEPGLYSAFHWATKAINESAMKLLDSKVVPPGLGSETIEFTDYIDDTYDEYEIRLNNVMPIVDNADLRIRVSDDGGLTWMSAADGYSWGFEWSSFSTVPATGMESDTSDSQIVVAQDVPVKLTYTNGINGIIRLYAPNQEEVTNISSELNYTESLPISYSVKCSGVSSVRSENVIDAIQIYFDNGFMMDGYFQLYGIKR